MLHLRIGFVTIFEFDVYRLGSAPIGYFLSPDQLDNSMALKEFKSFLMLM